VGRRSDALAALRSLRDRFPRYRDELRCYEQADFVEPVTWRELMQALQEAESLEEPAPGAGPAESS
jgi:hypothetical protein